VPPTGHRFDAWNDAAGKLAAAIEALAETCKSNDASGFDGVFQVVHESFHGLSGLVTGEHAADHHE